MPRLSTNPISSKASRLEKNASNSNKISILQKRVEYSIRLSTKLSAISVRHYKNNFTFTCRGPQGPVGESTASLLPRIEALEEESIIPIEDLPPLP